MKRILRRIIVVLVAGAMLAVSAGVLVVSAAAALFGVLKGMLGGPGASAVVALAAAIVIAVLALSLERWILRPGPSGREDEQGFLERLIDMAQDRPLMAAGALIVGVILAIRNPALTAIVVKAFLDPKPRAGKKA